MLTELGNVREMILNQLNRSDTGITPHTLVCFFMKQLMTTAKKWSDIEKNLSEDAHEAFVEAIMLEAGYIRTMLDSGDLLNIVGKNLHFAVLESLASVLKSLDTLRTSFCR